MKKAMRSRRSLLESGERRGEGRLVRPLQWGLRQILHCQGRRHVSSSFQGGLGVGRLADACLNSDSSLYRSLFLLSPIPSLFFPFFILGFGSDPALDLAGLGPLPLDLSIVLVAGFSAVCLSAF